MKTKTALVTGANKGIGFEIAKQLAETKKISVILGCRNEARGQSAVSKLKAKGLDVSYLPLDLEDYSTAISAKKHIEDNFESLDILVNNAGIQIETKEWMINTTLTIPPDTLKKTFEVNFFGLVYLTQTVLPLFKKSKEGFIVNLSSILGSLTTHTHSESPIYDTKTFAYNASKSALNAFTIHLAHALKKDSIGVYSAHPGWVKTDMGTEAAPTSISEGAMTVVDIVLNKISPKPKSGEFIHLGKCLPW